MSAKDENAASHGQRLGPPKSFIYNLKLFLSHSSPLTLATAAAGFTAVRLSWGAWSWWDLAVVVGMAAWWPFQEWLIHVYILHAKPVKVFGRTWESIFSSKHRAHHREPWKYDLIFIPGVAVVGGVILIPLAWHAALPAPLAWTGCAVYFLLSAHYEWCHFVSHAPYRPKTARMRRIVYKHRLHHFRNENFWYGVSMTFGDKVLRTEPDAATTPLSTTVRTLGVEEPAKPQAA